MSKSESVVITRALDTRCVDIRLNPLEYDFNVIDDVNRLPRLNSALVFAFQKFN